jgi:hypothetical protein
MFVETNEIRVVIANIDGLIRIDGKRHLYPSNIIPKLDFNIGRISVDQEILEALTYINNRSYLMLVSSFLEADLQQILNHIFSTLSDIRSSPANDSIQQFIVKWPITKALASSGMRPCSCIYLCGDIVTISQAQSLRLGTVFWNHEAMDDADRSELLCKGPDFSISNATELKDIFEKRYLGYLGEVSSTPADFFTDRVEDAYVNIITCPNKEFTEFEINVSGRYFRRQDPRHGKHALSLRLVNSKNHMERHKRIFSNIIGEMILHIVGESFDYLTRVPPKPSQTEDRIGDQIQYIPTLNFSGRRIPAAKIKPDLLRCIRDYSPQKDMGHYDARRDNVIGVFDVIGEVRGKDVVVIDDITTSGSTLMEITKVLYEAGAKKIVPIALSYHPENLTSFTSQSLDCPDCNYQLIPRHQRADGKPFYGCPGYFETGCRGSLNFATGVRKLNELIEIEELEEFEDIEF